MEAARNATSGGLGAELSDEALIGLYRGGAGEFAFAELIRRHQISLFRMLLAMLGDADDAERACEQVFFEASRKLDELTEPSNLYAFLVAIARAHVQKLEEARKKSRPKTKPRPPPKNPRAAVKRQVQNILQELDNDERVALMLADLEGEPVESIAKTLSRTPAETEELVERAREKFVEALTGAGEAPASVEEKHDDAPTLPTGSVLGARYRIESLLGTGGMGAVYKAVDLERDCIVAVKVLLPAAAKDSGLRKRFQREADAIRQLSHPNFVDFIEYRDADAPNGPAYFVMEFLDGRPLSRVLERDTKLPPQRALHVVRHILTGLAFAHEHGVVHRDVKPANVMLVTEAGDPDFAKLLDLGIARIRASGGVEHTRLTQKNEIFGTPAYMSPEQVRGDEVDGRADLYSLSVLLFELLAARPPFEAKSSMALFAMHLATQPPGVHEVAPDVLVPRAVQRLIDRGLEKEPAARFANAREYLNELEQVMTLDFDRLEEPEPRTTMRQSVPRKPVVQSDASLPERRPNPVRELAVRLRKIPFSLALLLIAIVALVIWRAYRWLALRP
ncbi:MAG: protein kinase domain-containing protein [Myxococcota bacterium]